MNKEQLMAKGLSPEAADEVIASFAGSTAGSPILELHKAIKKGGKADDLFKAEEEEEDEEKAGDGDDDDDDMEKGEDIDEDGEDLEKAISDINAHGEGAVVEMTDLAPYLRATAKFNKSMLKAVSDLVAENRTIKAQNAELYDIMHKAASVQVLTAETLEKAMGAPAGRKGVTTVSSQILEKAKAVDTDAKTVYVTLEKAMLTGDRRAGLVLSAFESAGKQVGKLDKSSREYIAELIKKGE